jgi:hypothetical protein
MSSQRRLHAGREGTLRDPVLLRSDLLDRLAVEVDVGILVAELHALGIRAERHDPRRVVERAGFNFSVELDAFRGDAPFGVRHDDVARRDQELLVGVVVGRVGKELCPAPELDLHLPAEAEMSARHALQSILT